MVDRTVWGVHGWDDWAGVRMPEESSVRLVRARNFGQRGKGLTWRSIGLRGLLDLAWCHSEFTLFLCRDRNNVTDTAF